MRLSFLRTTMAVAAMSFSLSEHVQAADVKLGEATFHQCGACHSIVEGQTKVGPSLYHVVGRKAGTLPGYAYSDAMKNSGVTWDEATLAKYIQAPRTIVPGTKMTFPGIKDPDKVQNLIAYLQSVSG